MLGKQARQQVQRDPIVGIVEGGDQDNLIGDIEIRVAGGQALCLEYGSIRQRKLNNLELAAEQVGSCRQALEILLKRSVIRIAAAGLHNGDDRICRNKTGNIIDVPVSIIS